VILRFAALFAILSLAACAPTLMPPGEPVQKPMLTEDAVITADGARLPLYSWAAKGKPRAIILALHGFNDYGTFIKAAGAFWAEQGITTYAYDQRGFGDAPNRGIWAGTEAYCDDLRTAFELIQGRNPGVPIFILGESMGGGVVMTTFAEPNPPAAKGVILAAPAVWGRSTMAFYERWALWSTVHTFPMMRLTGAGLNIVASDNIEMLRALGRDPKVIKATRVDTIYGLVDLMDAALESTDKFEAPALILYGQKDEIIKEGPIDEMLKRLPADARDRQTIVKYPGGYHMLLRDLEAPRVWRDIIVWMEKQGVPLYPQAGMN
jgi:acylglycerol lipase